MGFFLNNLGAYRVDRKKQNGLYKKVLKTLSVVALEVGYNNLFLPGGTITPGGIEQAEVGTPWNRAGGLYRSPSPGRIRPHVYVVPCTISYPLVLEAETLIEDFKEMGRLGTSSWTMSSVDPDGCLRSYGILCGIGEDSNPLRLRPGCFRESSQ